MSVSVCEQGGVGDVPGMAQTMMSPMVIAQLIAVRMRSLARSSTSMKAASKRSCLPLKWW